MEIIGNRRKKILLQFFTINLINVGPLSKTVGPGKNLKLITFILESRVQIKLSPFLVQTLIQFCSTYRDDMIICS